MMLDGRCVLLFTVFLVHAAYSFNLQPCIRKLNGNTRAISFPVAKRGLGLTLPSPPLFRIQCIAADGDKPLAEWEQTDVWTYTTQWCGARSTTPSNAVPNISGRMLSLTLDSGVEKVAGLLFEVPDSAKAAVFIQDLYAREYKCNPAIVKDQNMDGHDTWIGITGWSNQDIRAQLSIWAARRSLILTVKAFTLDSAQLIDLAKSEALSTLFVRSTPDDVDALRCKIISRKNNFYSTSQVVELQEMFSQEYRDPNGIVEKFVKYASAVVKTFQAKSETYFAPYFALVQSSGSGKSRLLLEASRVVRTVYVCCRQSSSSGFPLRTPQAINAMFPQETGQKANTYDNAFDHRLRMIVKSARLHLPTPQIGVAQQDMFMFASEVNRDVVWDLEAVAKAPPPENDDLVLLVIDEAHEWLDEEIFGISKFRYFRRRLREVGWKLNLCVVFVDTSSRIDNFAPSLSKDASARQVKEEGGRRLFHPFILILNDIFFDALPMGATDLTCLVKSNAYLSAGRVLVGKPLGSMSEQDHTSFLVRKLQGGALEMDSAAALSIGLCRVALTLNRQSVESVELVAENMAQLFACDLRREVTISGYVAEPWLAIAAATQWEDEVLINKILPSFQNAMLRGSVTTGSRGELVAQIVLLKAFDAACMASQVKRGGVVLLSSVVEQLLPPDSAVNALDAIPPNLDGVHIACCGFQKLAHHLQPHTCTMLAERHFGALFKDGQPGADAVIPIMASQRAYVMVQTKNTPGTEAMQAPSISTGAACINLMPSACLGKQDRFTAVELDSLDKNCVRIFLQLGADEPLAVCEDVKESINAAYHVATAKPLQIFGLNSRCISDELRSALQLILFGSEDLETFVEEQTEAAESLFLDLPHDVELVRQTYPFVINADPVWADLTQKQLLNACSNLNLSVPPTPTREDLLELLDPLPYDKKFRVTAKRMRMERQKTGWSRLTKSKLKERCDRIDLPYKSRMTKQDLITLLENKGEQP